MDDILNFHNTIDISFVLQSKYTEILEYKSYLDIIKKYELKIDIELSNLLDSFYSKHKKCGNLCKDIKSIIGQDNPLDINDKLDRLNLYNSVSTELQELETLSNLIIKRLSDNRSQYLSKVSKGENKWTKY